MLVAVTLGITRCTPAPPARTPVATAAATLANTNVNVVDAGKGRILPGQTVLVAGERIVAVGPAGELRVPRAARRVDGRGRYLIPGLWEMHSHLTMFGPTAPPLYLALGVTGVRDMDAVHFAEARAWRDSIAAGRLLDRAALDRLLVEARAATR